MVDVAIVGAGVTGLRTACLLYDAGIEVKVLEARPEVGGRLRSVNHGGSNIDMGATWFWPNELEIKKLIEEFDLETHRQYSEGDALYHEHGTSQRLGGNPIASSSYRFSNGAAALTDAMAASVKNLIEINTPITKISRPERSFLLETNNKTIEASIVVLALPPSLAINQIELDLDLPAELIEISAATPVWMGATAKAVAIYQTPFWRKEGLCGAAISYTGPLREIHDMSGPAGRPAALFGFGAGNASGDREVTKTNVIKQLEETFGPQASQPVEVLITNWSTEEHTTPISSAPNGNYHLYGHDVWQKDLLDGHLYFSSTETASAYSGHIEGALHSARSTAEKIIMKFDSSKDYE